MLGYMKPMSPNSHFLILFFYFFFFLSVHHHLIAFGDNDNYNQEQLEPVKLELMHRHHPKVVEKLHGEVKFQGINDRLKDIHDHDTQRHRAISATINRKQPAPVPVPVPVPVPEVRTEPLPDPVIPPSSSTPMGLKMISGSDFGPSEYFVHMKVGTPPQMFMLIVDTGSDLTWVKCRYRRCIGNCSTNAIHKSRNEKKIKFKNAFLANHSTTFRTIDCSTKECNTDFSDLFSVNECETPDTPCRYDYSYSGGSSAKGIFANETLTVTLTNKKEKQLHDTIIGCTETAQGRIFKGADGVVGLGTSRYSFTYKAAQSANGGGFCYCLVDHLSDQNAISYFILGAPSPLTPSLASSATPTGNVSSTKLFVGDDYGSSYGVDLVGISADGVMLNIPPRVWDIRKGGGTILDSGTSLTILAAPAFDMLAEAVAYKLAKFERLVPNDPFAYCFNNTLYSDHMAPKLRFHFGDGAVFEPPVKSYIMPITEYMSCLGFIAVPFPANNIIGNILQQNHLWEFDFFRRKVSFAPSECV